MIVCSGSQDNLYCVEESCLFHGQGGRAGTCSSVTHDDSAWFPSANFREAENKRIYWGGRDGARDVGPPERRVRDPNCSPRSHLASHTEPVSRRRFSLQRAMRCWVCPRFPHRNSFRLLHSVRPKTISLHALAEEERLRWRRSPRYRALRHVNNGLRLPALLLHATTVPCRYVREPTSPAARVGGADRFVSRRHHAYTP